ncbi:HGL329Cp [Eremothecium sinecaudum]|uniref:HGL329Cp n=1 Tax=Eremothecium sinecaudum TaxID=45286 RepID=A0A0X8HUZ9_9SACH|nr:HGL329Cp [Eremothecium sinecaudum]AMD22011.1 HGL329Cp [Eremothecium sinecaudum]
MSFKGLGKAVVRAPQSIKQKFNMGEQTSDSVYLEAERRFKEFETDTQKLSTECKRYFGAVNGMLQHQIGFAKAMEELFKPINMSLDPSNNSNEDSSKGVIAAEQYCELVAELQVILKPDLELIEERVIKPTQELQKIINNIRKMTVKRNHKQIDLDRRTAAYKKYENKKERSIKDDEKMYKAEAELEVAQQEYDYYNNMLKDELPALFKLESEMLAPLFVSFYYMQLNVFYTLFNKLKDMNIPYFDLNSDITQQFHARRGNIAETADSLRITNFRVGYSKTKLEMTRRQHTSSSRSSDSSSASPAPYTSSYGSSNSPAPPYVNPASNISAAPTGPPSYSPLPSAPTTYTTPSTAPTVETCTALYAFSAQESGDLSFPANAVIEVEDRSDADGWWVGRYNGTRGNFPANYVRLNKS